MHDLSRRESVEIRAAGGGIGAYVFGVDQSADLQVRQFLGHANGIERVARGAKDGANLRESLFETFQRVLAVVKDDAAKRLIDTVIKVIGKLAAADGLAYDLCHCCSGGSDQEPSRL